MAEVLVSKRLFQEILECIRQLKAIPITPELDDAEHDCKNMVF